MEQMTINDVCSKICSGGTPTSSVVSYYDGNIPWLNTNEVNFCNIYSTSKHISEEGLKKSAAKYVPENTVIVAMYGVTAGKCAIAKIPLTTNQACCNLIVDEGKAHYQYVYYFLKQQSVFLNSLAIGGAQQNLNALTIKKFKILLPPLPTQQKIASILSTYDNLIENNTKRIKLLEQMAENLYKEWFVRFRFPGHENTPMENGLPKGWKRGILSDIANINPSRMLKKGSFATYLDMGNMPTKGSFPSDWCIQQYNGGAKFTNGDILMARITPCLENGKVAYVNFLNEGEIAFGSTEYIVLTPKDNTIAPFIYNLCRTSHFIGYASNGMVGASGRQRVSGDVIGKYELTIPSEKIINEVKTLFDTLYSQIRPLSFQNRLLAKQRDLLLPRLMSGKLEVTP